MNHFQIEVYSHKLITLSEEYFVLMNFQTKPQNPLNVTGNQNVSLDTMVLKMYENVH